jgi:chromosome transmission fidelity protein 4
MLTKVATFSRRFLRLYSTGGNQGQIYWLDGEPITMVGRSRFLAVFYHVGEPLHNGTQQIGYKLIDAATNRVLASGAVSAISSRASLFWAGFSNDSSLLVMDSSGMVSMLVCVGDAPSYSSWEWMPMLDTLGLKKSSDDSFWPVTVYDGKLVCVPLKGGTKYPDAAARRPVTAALGLKLPLARGTIAKRYAINDENGARHLHPLTLTSLPRLFLLSIALEEISLRAAIALSQKKVVQVLTVGEGDEEFDREYQALSAQVVSHVALSFARYNQTTLTT